MNSSTDQRLDGSGAPNRGRGLASWRVHALLVVLVCAAIYWPMLGRASFSGTEGHRAIPAFQMLDGGDWLVPHLFDRPYLRKPPGMPWAIALSSMVFGPGELAARAVSALCATLSGLVALSFGRLWFGAGGGLFAALGQVLMPVFWSSARSADIESLHNLGIQLACFSAAHVLLGPAPARPVFRVGMSALLAGGIAIAALAKGPAGITAFVSVLIAAGIVRRSARIFLRPELLAALGVSGALLTWIFVEIARRTASLPATPVTQSVDEFLWENGRTAQVLLLLPSSLLMAMPASLAMLFPWGPDAIAESRGAPAQRHPSAFAIARALSIAVLLSLTILTVAGVSNPRYTMATQAVIPPIVGYVGLGLSGYFILKRPPIARAMMLGHPAVLGGCMLAAAIVALFIAEPRRERIGGREAGRLIAQMVPAGAEIWADHLIEARPDVLWYAANLEDSPTRRIVWKPLATSCPVPPDGRYLVLRDDPQAGELDRYAKANLLSAMTEVGRGAVYQYTFRVFRAGSVMPTADAATGQRGPLLQPLSASGGEPVN